VADSIRILGSTYELPKELGQWKLAARPGGYLIAEGPAGERVRLVATRSRGKLSLTVGGIAWQAEVLAPATRGGAAAGGGDSDLVSQFPGKVGKILVAEGQAVQAGEPLLLIEAMKMEFAIKAPFAGTVTKLLVQAGQQLAPGDRFLDLAPAADPSAKGGKKP
jgi:biotin carboxyl carrier protein